MDLNCGMTLVMGYSEVSPSLAKILSVLDFSNTCDMLKYVYLPYCYLKEMSVMFIINEYTYTIYLFFLLNLLG